MYYNTTIIKKSYYSIFLYSILHSYKFLAAYDATTLLSHDFKRLCFFHKIKMKFLSYKGFFFDNFFFDNFLLVLYTNNISKFFCFLKEANLSDFFILACYFNRSSLNLSSASFKKYVSLFDPNFIASLYIYSFLFKLIFFTVIIFFILLDLFSF